MQVVLTEDWEDYSDGPWWAVNNVWGKESLVNGPGYTQRITIETTTFPNAWRMEWNWPNDYKPSIYAYPEVIFGYKPWDPGEGTLDFTSRVKKLDDFTVSFDLEISGDDTFNVALEMWLTDEKGGGPGSITTEVMIWLHNGQLTPGGEEVDRYEGDGYSSAIWFAEDWGDASGESSASWDYVALFADADYLSGTIDLKDVLDALREAGMITGEEYVSGFELGAEIAAGDGSLIINSLDHSFAIRESANEVLGTAADDVLRGTDARDEIFGLAGNDSLFGKKGKDILDGGSGSDQLKGGKSKDVFVFADALGPENVDLVRDFDAGADRISLDLAIFGAIGDGKLAKHEFRKGVAVEDADDRIIYDRSTGDLFYDPDGTGPEAQIKFATLSTGPKLFHDDFFAA